MRANIEQIAFGLLVVTLACGRDATPRASTASRAAESAPVIPRTTARGTVAVRQHSADAFERAPQFRVDPNAVVAITADADGTFDIADAQHVLLLSDGRVATIDPFAARILIFGAVGRGQRRLGRQGRGPGEFANIEGVARLDGDTLLVVDGGNPRFSWWTADGAMVAERPFPDAPPLGAFVTIDGVLADGRVVLHSDANAPADSVADRPSRPPLRIRLVTAREGVVQELVRVPGNEAVRTTLVGVRPMVVPVRFGRRTHLAVWDSTVAVGTGEAYQIDRLRADGTVESTVHVQRPRQAIPRAVREADVTTAVQHADSLARRSGVDPEPRRQLARATPYADSLPPYDAVFVTPDRRTLWILDARLPGDSSWAATGFRGDGAIVARIVATGVGRPVAFGDDRVVVRVEDADGVASLRVHRIVPR